jgi:hypothetical protein
MSIYATWLDFSDDSEDGAPIRYQQSHILPSDDDPRGGNVDVAFIPGFIERTDRPPLSEDDAPMHPWLRLSVDDATVVLDRKQVARLHETLGRWLATAGGGS